MRLVQYTDTAGAQHVAIVEDADTLIPLVGVSTTRELANIAISLGGTMIDTAQTHKGDTRIDYNEVVDSGRLLPPVTHGHPAHFLCSRPGLTHLGSASAPPICIKPNNRPPIKPNQ